MGLTVSRYLIRYKVYYILTWAVVSFVLMFISYDPTRPVIAQWIGSLTVTGLGIKNLKRRLELLYSGKHELDINKEENTYQTTLKLQYND